MSTSYQFGAATHSGLLMRFYFLRLAMITTIHCDQLPFAHIKLFCLPYRPFVKPMPTQRLLLNRHLRPFKWNDSAHTFAAYIARSKATRNSQNGSTVAISKRSVGECAPRMVGPKDKISISDFLLFKIPHSNPAWIALISGVT